MHHDLGVGLENRGPNIRPLVQDELQRHVEMSLDCSSRYLAVAFREVAVARHEQSLRNLDRIEHPGSWDEVPIVDVPTKAPRWYRVDLTGFGRCHGCDSHVWTKRYRDVGDGRAVALADGELCAWHCQRLMPWIGKLEMPMRNTPIPV